MKMKISMSSEVHLNRTYCVLYSEACEGHDVLSLVTPKIGEAPGYAWQVFSMGIDCGNTATWETL